MKLKKGRKRNQNQQNLKLIILKSKSQRSKQRYNLLLLKNRKLKRFLRDLGFLQKLMILCPKSQWENLKNHLKFLKINMEENHLLLIIDLNLLQTFNMKNYKKQILKSNYRVKLLSQQQVF